MAVKYILQPNRSIDTIYFTRNNFIKPVDKRNIIWYTNSIKREG